MHNNNYYCKTTATFEVYTPQWHKLKQRLVVNKWNGLTSAKSSFRDLFGRCEFSIFGGRLLISCMLLFIELLAACNCRWPCRCRCSSACSVAPLLMLPEMLSWYPALLLQPSSPCIVLDPSMPWASLLLRQAVVFTVSERYGCRWLAIVLLFFTEVFAHDALFTAVLDAELRFTFHFLCSMRLKDHMFWVVFIREKKIIFP